MKDLGAFLPFILIALVFWFLIVRPQRKRQQEMQATQRSVAPGAEVMLGSGIYGTVTDLEDDVVRLQVAPGTELRVARQAVVRVVTPVDSPEEADDTDDLADEEPTAVDNEDRHDR